ncbi:hypothetical protein, partial [Enterococcus faecalis]|uniref:hypothetical protein n=1 Tax=Enterococcus faecalis TaxID=1351 RepID=UPI0022F0A8AE
YKPKEQVDIFRWIPNNGEPQAPVTHEQNPLMEPSSNRTLICMKKILENATFGTQIFFIE